VNFGPIVARLTKLFVLSIAVDGKSPRQNSDCLCHLDQQGSYRDTGCGEATKQFGKQRLIAIAYRTLFFRKSV